MSVVIMTYGKGSKNILEYITPKNNCLNDNWVAYKYIANQKNSLLFFMQCESFSKNKKEKHLQTYVLYYIINSLRIIRDNY